MTTEDSETKPLEDKQAADDWLWDKVARETLAVQGRIEQQLANYPLIDMLMRHFGSLLFGAAQKLIEKRKQSDSSTPRDEAVIMTCARLFTECFAGYQLVRQGMILQSIVLLRSAFEISTQGILFLERPEEAEKWLNGKQIRPKDVRELTAMPETERSLYQRLANLAHPNYDALPYLSVPVPLSTGLTTAFLYGGWYAPKEAGQISIQFLWAQLVLLERFYAVLGEELDGFGVLWAPGVRQEELGDFTWDTYLSAWRNALTDLGRQYAQTLPHDLIEIAMSMSDYSPVQKDEFRRGFEAFPQIPPNDSRPSRDSSS